MRAKGFWTGNFLCQWSRNCFLIQEILFRCGTFYNALRGYIKTNYTGVFVNSGSDLTTECHKAIKLLQEDDKQREIMLHDFMDMCVTSSNLLAILKEWAPCMV